MQEITGFLEASLDADILTFHAAVGPSDDDCAVTANLKSTVVTTTITDDLVTVIAFLYDTLTIWCIGDRITTNFQGAVRSATISRELISVVALLTRADAAVAAGGAIAVATGARVALNGAVLPPGARLGVALRRVPARRAVRDSEAL